MIYGSLLFLQLQSSNIGDVHKTELWVQQNPAFGEKNLASSNLSSLRCTLRISMEWDWKSIQCTCKDIYIYIYVCMYVCLYVCISIHLYEYYIYIYYTVLHSHQPDKLGSGPNFKSGPGSMAQGFPQRNATPAWKTVWKGFQFYPKHSAFKRKVCR